MALVSVWMMMVVVLLAVGVCVRGIKLGELVHSEVVSLLLVLLLELISEPS